MTRLDPVALHPMQRVIAAAVAEERPTLEAFLDDYRNAVTRKVRGASEADVCRQLVPSATTLGGIVKHLRWVELTWFQRTLAQVPDSELPPSPWDDPNATFRIEPGDTVEGLIADYDRQCELSRQIARATRAGRHRATPRDGPPPVGDVVFSRPERLPGEPARQTLPLRKTHLSSTGPSQG